MGGFTELGLSAELVEAAEAQGFREPAPVQRAAVAVLRRGGNAVLHASSGSGVTAAYGLALVSRLHEGEPGGDGPRALVIVPTDHAMSRVAGTLAPFAGSVGLRVTAMTDDWAAPADAAIVVATADAANAAVQRSALKLEALQVLVLDGAAQILELADTADLEAVLGVVPREAQRVVATAEAGAAVVDFVERHVRRAMWIPPRPAEPAEPTPEVTGTITYSVVGEARKMGALARWLAARGAGDATIFCRTPQRAALLNRFLAERGFNAESDVSAVTDDAAGDAGTGADAISYDVPFDGASLRARHSGGGHVFAEPRELPHLRRIAADAGLSLRAQDVAQGSHGSDDVSAFREQLRRALREEDLGAQLLVIEPLMEEFSAAEIAAAASALLRRRTAREPKAAEAPRAPAASAGTPKPFTRLFLSVGSKDELRPKDLVGAITGEAGIRGASIGKVEIRETFSVVEIAADAADKVIRALNGTSLRGRALRVDYDRQQRSTGRPAGRPEGRGPGRPSGAPPRRPR